MSDDRSTSSPFDGADGRDPVVAELLDVAPLPELTRRRLVAAALEAAGETPATGTGRSLRLLGAAAALAAVVAGGVLALGGGGERPTAARDASAEDRSLSAPDVAPNGEAGTTDSESGVPAALGDLGTVSDAATLRARVLDALGRTQAQPPAGNTVPCAEEVAVADPGLGAPVAYATAKYQDRSVIVLVVADEGAETAVVVTADGCTVTDRVPL